jgi:hypothetical protein
VKSWRTQVIDGRHDSRALPQVPVRICAHGLTPIEWRMIELAVQGEELAEARARSTSGVFWLTKEDKNGIFVN